MLLDHKWGEEVSEEEIAWPEVLRQGLLGWLQHDGGDRSQPVCLVWKCLWWELVHKQRNQQELDLFQLSDLGHRKSWHPGRLCLAYAFRNQRGDHLFPSGQKNLIQHPSQEAVKPTARRRNPQNIQIGIIYLKVRPRILWLYSLL